MNNNLIERLNGTKREHDKVLRGIPAGTIPVVTPEANLLINYKKTQELGLTVSEGLLNIADEVIY